ncbi:MAG: Fur family transcriptional regulator [Fimbriimonadaceae bacterium]
MDNEFIDRIKESGLRLTQPRIKILEAMKANDRPIGVYQLHDQMKATKLKVNIVSIYRTLAAFQELGIVHYIPSQQGYLLCEAECKNDQQTEHLVCDQCGNVNELPIPDCATNDLKEQADSRGFKTTKIRVEVSGICLQCQKS